MPPGTRSVSVFLVNYRPPAPDVQRDVAYIFQPELSLHSLQPFTPRPDLHAQASEDWDDKVADLQYADAVEYAVGHNVSAFAVREASGVCREGANRVDACRRRGESRARQAEGSGARHGGASRGAFGG